MWDLSMFDRHHFPWRKIQCNYWLKDGWGVGGGLRGVQKFKIAFSVSVRRSHYAQGRLFDTGNHLIITAGKSISVLGRLPYLRSIYRRVPLPNCTASLDSKADTSQHCSVSTLIMPKRKARQDPDSSDEDVGHYGQASLKTDARPKKKAGKSKASQGSSDGGPFEHHSRPSEAEARVHRHCLACRRAAWTNHRIITSLSSSVKQIESHQKNFTFMLLQAARDSLARLHGEPTRPDFVSDSTEKAKKTILDSLVWLLFHTYRAVKFNSTPECMPYCIPRDQVGTTAGADHTVTEYNWQQFSQNLC